jgi:hypothetical protein
MPGDVVGHEMMGEVVETGRDYSDRNGFPRGVGQARGTAEGVTPVDFPVTATLERVSRELEPV